MSDTIRLGLPLLDPAQAQKHVTVNEALFRLDALSHLAIKGIGLTQPPASPMEGDTFAVGTGASDTWGGQDLSLAVFSNGGWVFVTPRIGWSAWSEQDGSRVVFDGVGWAVGAGALSPNGAGFLHRVYEVDATVSAGATSVVPAAVPANAIVYGITGRVLTSIGGAATLSIGVSGSPDRYGSGIGTGAGSWLRGMTSSPLAYYGATDLLLTAESGVFDGSGTLRIAVHFAELTLPRG